MGGVLKKSQNLVVFLVFFKRRQKATKSHTKQTEIPTDVLKKSLNFERIQISLAPPEHPQRIFQDITIAVAAAAGEYFVTVMKALAG